MGAVDERFGEVDFAALVKVSRERGEDPIEHALALPLLKASKASRVWWVATGHVRPRSSGAKHPEDPVQDVARITPRPTALRSGPLSLGSGNELLDRLPLLVLQIHRRRYKHLSPSMEMAS